jgi:uncharacterized membrane protein
MRRAFSTDGTRLEAFSDGVIAVIITILVLDLHAPAGTDLTSLATLAPTFAAYVLSFVFVGIYWNNHHHMLRASDGVDGRAMWANLHLLFWLSLLPFTTSWLGAHPFAPYPTALYGFVLLMDAIAYTILQNALLAVNGAGSPFAQALRTDVKGKIWPGLYVVGIVCAFVAPVISYACYVVVAVVWFVPDRRMEPAIAARRGDSTT